MNQAWNLYLSLYFIKADTLSRFHMDSGILRRQERSTLENIDGRGGMEKICFSKILRC